MPRRIHILPDAVANQIAAGEVVERPASVVKELVENALDAAATRIDIELRNGGKTLIRVADDGCGMGRDDALLALDRHATSKIARAEDLETVRSFGFRGEALPSIASVSRFTLETAEAGGVATRLRAAGGRILAVEDCARQPGTSVTVQGLFFNVPARAKFLRNAGAETRAAVDSITALALTHLSTGFRLESNGRALLELPPVTDLVSRVATLWGDEAAAQLIAAAHEAPAARVAGLVDRPDAALSGTRRVHLFIAGRPFRDRTLVRAAERAYQTTVPAGARPSLLLYLDVPVAGVDVNVHPTKAQVRFRDAAAVEAVVEEGVRAALRDVESAATLDRAPAPPQLRRRVAAGPGLESAGSDAANQLAFFVPAPDLADQPSVGAEGGGAEAEEQRVLHEQGQAHEHGDVADGGERAADAATMSVPGTATIPVAALAAAPSLWQVHETYILAETRSGLLIIDQHSAHERILFEQLMRGFRAGDVASQRLLFPITLRLSPAEHTVVEESRSLLEGAGFEVDSFGGRSVIVHAVPTPHPYFDAERCLREMLAELAAGSALTRAATNQHERIAMIFACKGAIKAGQRLSPRESAELFDRLFATELPYHDVHGRPTIVRLSLQELERRFGRHG